MRLTVPFVDHGYRITRKGLEKVKTRGIICKDCLDENYFFFCRQEMIFRFIKIGRENCPKRAFSLKKYEKNIKIRKYLKKNSDIFKKMCYNALVNVKIIFCRR